jgi:hypothetical protein
LADSAVCYSQFGLCSGDTYFYFPAEREEERERRRAGWSAAREAGEGLAVEHVKDIAAMSLVDTSLRSVRRGVAQGRVMMSE